MFPTEWDRSESDKFQFYTLIEYVYEEQFNSPEKFISQLERNLYSIK